MRRFRCLVTFLKENDSIPLDGRVKSLLGFRLSRRIIGSRSALSCCRQLKKSGCGSHRTDAVSPARLAPFSAKSFSLDWPKPRTIQAGASSTAIAAKPARPNLVLLDIQVITMST